MSQDKWLEAWIHLIWLKSTPIVDLNPSLVLSYRPPLETKTQFQFSLHSSIEAAAATSVVVATGRIVYSTFPLFFARWLAEVTNSPMWNKFPSLTQRQCPGELGGHLTIELLEWWKRVGRVAIMKRGICDAGFGESGCKFAFSCPL